MAGAIPNISRTSIWNTWKVVRKELRNSSIRDVVDFLDYDVNPNFWIKRLVNNIRRGTYEPDPSIASALISWGEHSTSNPGGGGRFVIIR